MWLSNESCVFVYTDVLQNMHSNVKISKRWKTEMCKNVPNCKYGNKCDFAHSTQELRKPTRLCMKWLCTGTCPYGSRCLYIHDYRVCTTKCKSSQIFKSRDPFDQYIYQSCCKTLQQLKRGRLLGSKQEYRLGTFQQVSS